jgi:hypothetical protein
MPSPLGVRFVILVLCVSLLIAACVAPPDPELGEDIGNVFDELEIGGG